MAMGYCIVVVFLIVVQDYTFVSLETVVHYIVVVAETARRIILWLLCIVILQLLHSLSCYMFSMHLICI